MVQFIKIGHEKRLITKLQKSGWFTSGELNVRKKIIHFGLYGMTWVFMDTASRNRVYLLVKIHNYKVFETVFKIEEKIY